MLTWIQLHPARGSTVVAIVVPVVVSVAVTCLEPGHGHIGLGHTSAGR